MKQLISDTLNTSLDNIVTFCFTGNRIADRGMTNLAVKFGMNKTEKVLHPALAHVFPKLADLVSEYQSERDNLTFYGATPADGTLYESPLDFFNKMLAYMLDLEQLVTVSINLAEEEEDRSTYAFLLRFMAEVGKVTAQCVLLVDKAEAYKNDWNGFDHRIEDFVL